MRIRITKNPPDQDSWRHTYHPDEDRIIRVGDEFDAYIRDDPMFRQYAAWHGYNHDEYAISHVFFEEVESNHKCYCSNDVLLNAGCQCGGV